jgi:hypothetical protein
VCLFITVLLPKKAQTSKIGELAKKHHFGWYNLSNQITKQLDGDYFYFCTTSGMCDCETLLGSKCKISTVQNSEIDIARFRRKGWNDTKIARWIEQKSAIKNESIQDFDEVQKWMEFITEILEKRLTNKIGILIHMYSKSVNDESFTLGESYNQSSLTEDYLLNLDQNRVHFFTKASVSHQTSHPRKRVSMEY